MSETRSEKVRCVICGAVFDASVTVCPVCGVGTAHFVPLRENPPAVDRRAQGEERFVIVGSGIAAVTAAAEIRRIHPHASIILIGEETALPYDRPLLSKTPFTPQTGERFALHPPEWYSTHGIFLLFGRRAVRLLPRAKQIELSDGEILSYDKCILATGARSAVPPIEGRALPGTFTLRTLSDAEAIARHSRPDMRAVVVGGGVLGLEAAWQLYLGSCHVTLLEAADRLLGGRVDREVSEKIIRLAEARGVEIRTEVHIARLEGEEHVRRVILPGEYLRADLVLFCCGNHPRTELAQEAGLEVDRGIVVNSRMMTDKYGIYACGDCAQLGRDVCGMWSTAENMGRFAGRNAAGEDAMYHPCPTPLLAEAFGTRMFAAGDCGTDGKEYRTEHSESESGDRYLYFRDNRLCGAVLLGDISQASALLDRIRSGAQLSSV